LHALFPHGISARPKVSAAAARAGEAKKPVDERARCHEFIFMKSSHVFSGAAAAADLVFNIHKYK
jgi:hypothetical protein